ncbi:MAG: D-aminoacylase [Chitinophagaceae bacterium]|nr:D-aminoacylase [Chitinophagaceae bacterium]
MRNSLFLAAFVCLIIGCESKPTYDTIIKNGMIYDGSGTAPVKGDIGINADTIAFIGDLSQATAKETIDAKGKAVSPGFINMLSWAVESLIEDGNSESDIRQGVTLEVFGEGSSMGPLSPKMKEREQNSQGDIKYKVDWTSFGGYLDFMEKRGVSCNIASFLGATTVRDYVIGEDNRQATPAELDTMRMLVKAAMEEGALGIGTSLIYPPAFFASTNELKELTKEAARYGGSYISHMRSEGNNIEKALNELIEISSYAKCHGELYHLKMAGKDNWGKYDTVIAMIENARKAGIDISANMYNYTAGATGMTASFPPSLQDGGFGKLRERLQDPKIRAEMAKAMNTNATDWENLYYGANGAEHVLLLAFKQDSLKKYTGKTLAEVAKIRGTSPENTAMDLIIQDSTRVGVAYFLMNEDNIRKQIQLPWVSFGSDEGSYSTKGVFLKANPHPRAYGNVARLLGKYTRDEKLIPLETAVYKLSGLPAKNLKLQRRGLLKVGYYADVVVFDPATVNDKSTYDKPHQYSEGVSDVWVNGVAVLRNNEHTGKRPGKALRGPGYKSK